VIPVSDDTRDAV